MYPWWDSHILHCTRWNYLSSCSVLTWQRMHVDFDLWWSHLLYRGPLQSVLSIHWVHHSTSTYTLYCNPSFCTLCSNGKSSGQAFFRMIQCSPVPGSKIPGPVKHHPIRWSCGKPTTNFRWCTPPNIWPLGTVAPRDLSRGRYHVLGWDMSPMDVLCTLRAGPAGWMVSLCAWVTKTRAGGSLRSRNPRDFLQKEVTFCLDF